MNVEPHTALEHFRWPAIERGRVPPFYPLVVSVMEGNSEVINEQPMTWGQLIGVLENPMERASKEDCYLLKLARFGEACDGNGSLRSDANLKSISGIEADYDGEVVDLQEAAARLTSAGIEAFLHTTASHGVIHPPRCHGGPRWRVLVPLSQPYEPLARYGFVVRLNELLGGILSAKSFQASHAGYFGRVAGVKYQTGHVIGGFLDQLGTDETPPEPTPSSLVDSVVEPVDQPVEHVDVAALDCWLTPCARVPPRRGMKASELFSLFSAACPDSTPRSLKAFSQALIARRIPRTRTRWGRNFGLLPNLPANVQADRNWPQMRNNERPPPGIA